MLNYVKTTSPKDFRGLAQKIGKMFDKYNEKRQSQLNDIKALQDKVFELNNGFNSFNNSYLELPNVYEQHQTLKAHLLDSIYTSPAGLFDVSASTSEGQKSAIKQKIMLTDALEKMKIADKIEKIIENVIETGECTLFVSYEAKYKPVRRAVKDFKGDFFVFEKKKIFEGATVKNIDAQDFVFDIEQKNNWNACKKIYRTYASLNELKANKNNTYLTNEVIEKIKNSGRNAKNTDRYDISDDSDKIEILELWGDIELENGKIYENHLAVCANREVIIRFEPNPYVDSPFIHATLLENPATKRGISPLKAILPLQLVTNQIMNHQLDAYSLTVNPPYLAPSGAFKGEQRVEPGKIIEYDASLLPQMPTPLNFSGAINGWDFVEYFKNSIEGTTGIYRTMAGSVANKNKTATELNYSVSGQNTRLNLLLDGINRKIILPMVEKIADTIANFKFGRELITRVSEGKTEIFEITDEIRAGEYFYKYSDRKASLEHKWRQKELGDVILAFANIQELKEKINWIECFKLSLEQLGVENWEKFLNAESAQK